MSIFLVPFNVGELVVGSIVMGIMLGVSVGVLIAFGMILGGIVGVPAKLLTGENPISWMKPPALKPPKRRSR